MLIGSSDLVDDKVKNKNLKTKNTSSNVDLTAAVMDGKIKTYFSLQMKIEKNEYITKNFLSKLEYTENVRKISHFWDKRNFLKSGKETFFKVHGPEKYSKKSSYFSKKNGK